MPGIRTRRNAGISSGNRGMTLLELLVAISIFALIGIASYRLLGSVVMSSDINKARMVRLEALQTTISVLGNDLMQLAARPIREDDQTLAAFMTGAEHTLLQYSRSGWANPLGAARSDIQRVSWRLEPAADAQEGQVLVRFFWPVLDRQHESAPMRQPLLGGLTTIKLRVMDHNKQWQQTWPVANTATGKPDLTAVPVAVEVELHHAQLGAIKRIWVVR